MKNSVINLSLEYCSNSKSSSSSFCSFLLWFIFSSSLLSSLFFSSMLSLLLELALSSRFSFWVSLFSSVLFFLSFKFFNNGVSCPAESNIATLCSSVVPYLILNPTVFTLNPFGILYPDNFSFIHHLINFLFSHLYSFRFYF